MDLMSRSCVDLVDHVTVGLITSGHLGSARYRSCWLGILGSREVGLETIGSGCCGLQSVGRPWVHLQLLLWI